VIDPKLEQRARTLAAERVPFVTAIVVRNQRPSSVRPGDTAIVLADGTIEGFVGGACAQPSLRLHAMRVLETGEPLLQKIVPGDGEGTTEEGAVTVRKPGLSGGALEIFLEPRLPAPRVAVVGDTPIALALASLGGQVGFDVVPTAGVDLEPADDDAAVVVASHGHAEEEALARALRSSVAYVGLVASRRRGTAVVDALRRSGVSEGDLARLRTPAGLDIGARTPEEIALAILAEIVSVRRADAPHFADAAPAVAVDPVCGMSVPGSEPTLHVEHTGHTVWFCGEGCRAAFQADPDRYAAAL
jgi:xanthine dehydrogenase accessory factor